MRYFLTESALPLRGQRPTQRNMQWFETWLAHGTVVEIASMQQLKLLWALHKAQLMVKDQVQNIKEEKMGKKDFKRMNNSVWVEIKHTLHLKSSPCWHSEIAGWACTGSMCADHAAEHCSLQHGGTIRTLQESWCKTRTQSRHPDLPSEN